MRVGRERSAINDNWWGQTSRELGMDEPQTRGLVCFSYQGNELQSLTQERFDGSFNDVEAEK